MECVKCLELLSEFIDGTLGHAEGRGLAAHLDACLPCAAIRLDLQLIIKLARRLREDFSAIALPPDLKRAVFSKDLGRAATP